MVVDDDDDFSAYTCLSFSDCLLVVSFLILTALFPPFLRQSLEMKFLTTGIWLLFLKTKPSITLTAQT